MTPSKISTTLLVLLLATSVFAELPAGLTQEQKDDIAKLLNEAIVKGHEHPFRIVCSATSLTCTPPAVFISAAAISAIEIKDIPSTATKLTVVVSAGESDASGQINVRRKFTDNKIPDRIIIAVNKDRRYRATYKTDASQESSDKSSDRDGDGDHDLPANASPARKYAEMQSNAPDEMQDDPI